MNFDLFPVWAALHFLSVYCWVIFAHTQSVFSHVASRLPGKWNDRERQADDPDVREHARVVDLNHGIPDDVSHHLRVREQTQRVRDVSHVFLQQREDKTKTHK